MPSAAAWDDLVARAADRLPAAVLDYFLQGSHEGVSTAEAAAAWDEYRILPRVLRDVTTVDLGRELLGTDIASPVCVAPTSLQKAADPDGEVAMARAVAAVDSLMVLSSNSGSTFADVAATDVKWWLQMYVTADRAESLPVIEAAAWAGASGIVLTADTPVVASRQGVGSEVWDLVGPDWLRVNFPADSVWEKAQDLGPQDIAWLADVSGLPVVVKGVLHPVDARRCVDAGAAAVWVSNHGGRQQDYAVSTAAALPGVVAAVGGQAPVLVDGGIRSGRHVLVAEALGADAVFVGRPPLLGLAAGGADGARAVLDDLTREYTEVRRLVGAASNSDVNDDLVRLGNRL